MYSPNRNQPGVLAQTVTTVWRTELGTTLSIGFNSTTGVSAYFRYLGIPSLPQPRHHAKFLASMAPLRGFFAFKGAFFPGFPSQFLRDDRHNLVAS